MIEARAYGTRGSWVVLLHGGPGAPGSMAPVARGLADSYRVLEPLQRGAGEEPLTVARHIEDMLEVIEARCEGTNPAIVGSSWGAMLALAFAAEHADRAGPVVLIGCGTFDTTSRARMMAILAERMDDDLRERMDELESGISGPDADRRLEELGDAILPLYSVDRVPGAIEGGSFDARAHHETWNDMLRLQAEGVYPAAFRAIRSPVLMLHGDSDPHPGEMIRASLAPHLPSLEYLEFERCGHYPWAERAVRYAFFEALRGWLARHPFGTRVR